MGYRTHKTLWLFVPHYDSHFLIAKNERQKSDTLLKIHDSRQIPPSSAWQERQASSKHC